MPWDGSNNYQYPPGTEGVPDQTIESIKYNTFIADLRDNDLNKPRPITRGGTGAGDAATALSNLGGEKAQQVVTNYDAMTWLSGSFYSAASATASPVAGHRFVGMSAVQDVNNIVIQAFDLDSTPVGEMYTKIKKDGVWSDSGAWGTGFVKKSGDTMSGALNIETPDATVFFKGGNSGAAARIQMTGDAGAGIGSKIFFNTGNGATLDAASGGSIRLATAGVVGFTLTAGTGNSLFAGTATAQSFKSGLSSDSVIGDLTVARAAADGAIHFGTSKSAYLQYTSSSYNLVGGPLNCGRINSSSQIYAVSLVHAGSSPALTLAAQLAALDSGAGYANVAVRCGAVESQYFANTSVVTFGPVSAHPLVIRTSNANRMTVAANGDVTIHSTTSTIQNNTGALVVAGSLGVQNGLNVQGMMTLNSGATPVLVYQINGVSYWHTFINSSQYYYVLDANQSNGVYIVQDATAWSGYSDRRAKTKNGDFTVLDKLAGWYLYDFTWKHTGKKDVGAFAQEVMECFPIMVVPGTDDADVELSGVADPRAWGLMREYAGLFALTGVKELLARVEALENKELH